MAEVPSEAVRTPIGATPGPGSEGHHLRHRGVELIGRSLARSSQDNYASGFRSWGSFCGLAGREKFFNACTSREEMRWALIDFAAWCFDAGNLAETITGKFAAVQ